ncbi:MAG: cation:proton antiporter subunit C [Spirochaetales bacterium]|nr:cation:proton antiporter subunit C [Spirochaetales bacterium]
MKLELLLILILFLVGFWGIVGKNNIIKKIFGLNMINAAAVILFILEGSRSGADAPILGKEGLHIVDPVPQALMLTAIVIGVCITALALALAVHLYRVSGSFDIDRIRDKVHNEN